MELSEIVMLIGGLLIGLLTWFAKREMSRVDARINELREHVRSLELASKTNDTRDRERWQWIDKSMEDRRDDIRKIYDMIQDIYKQSCDWRQGK